MNMKFAAFASAPGVWAGADGRNERGASDLVNLQRRLSEADLSLAGRGFLYQRFCLTSAARNKQMLHSRFFDRTRWQSLLDDMLSRGETRGHAH